MSRAKELAKDITAKTNALGCNILNNCNEAAGQSVMHFHVHILPRYKNDDLKLEFTDHSKQYNLDDIFKEIK